MFEYLMEMENTRMRDVVCVNGNWFVVDTVKTPDAGWETGIAKIDVEALREAIIEDEDDELMDEDIRTYYDEFTGWWDVQNYRTKREAAAGPKRVYKNGRLDEDE